LWKGVEGRRVKEENWKVNKLSPRTHLKGRPEERKDVEPQVLLPDSERVDVGVRNR
jgi:hypothetical protein